MRFKTLSEGKVNFTPYLISSTEQVYDLLVLKKERHPSLSEYFLNTAHPGHDIIVLSTKGNNEKLTKILCYTETVFSSYYHKMPNTV
jgi:hypothetical protein